MVDPDRLVRRYALRALTGQLRWARYKQRGHGEGERVLVALQGVLDPLLDTLIAPDSDRCRPPKASVVCLVDLFGAHAAPVVDRLVSLLPRKRAVIMLGSIGPAAAPAVPALTRMLDLRFERLVQTTVRTLGQIGPAAHEAGAALLHYLDDPAIAPYAASALQNIYLDSDVLLPLALESVDRQIDRLPRPSHGHGWDFRSWPPDPGELLPVLIRTRNLRALARLGPRAAPAIPLLLQELATGDERTRAVAAKTLGAIGPAARPALNALWRARKTTDPYLLECVEKAIIQIESSGE